MTPAPTTPPAGTVPYKLEQRHCIVAGEDDDHFTVWLIVGPQQFCLTQWALLKDEADHFEGMARTAMDKLVAAGEAAERKRAAEVAHDEARRADELLARAAKRYKNRELLAAMGSTGDPDAECIAMEAARDTAASIAAAIERGAPESA